MNYSIIPFKNFYCTQNYNDLPTHYKQSQSTNGVRAYPIDIVDDIYCGCDEMIVVKINGVSSTTVNQIFVQSTSPVSMPIGEYFITYLITHPNDEDIYANLYVGKKFKRKDLIIHKGTDGGVGAHIDLAIAKSKQAGWVLTSFSEYVLPDSIKPEEGMYLDETFTTMSNAGGMTFKNLPKKALIPVPVSEDKTKNQVKVICGLNTLYVRTGPSRQNEIIGFTTPGIYNVISTKDNDSYKWYQVEDGKWFANAEGCTEELNFYSYDDLLIGSQIIMPINYVPSNYLLCNGSNYDIKKYKELYEVLKTDKLPQGIKDVNLVIKCKNIEK